VLVDASGVDVTTVKRVQRVLAAPVADAMKLDSGVQRARVLSPHVPKPGAEK
jgi:hypothetical protein